MESPNRATDKPRVGYSVVEYAKANQPKRPLSYDERQLEKKRKNRIASMLLTILFIANHLEYY
jgi:accessory gene regulator protein AgrB